MFRRLRNNLVIMQMSIVTLIMLIFAVSIMFMARTRIDRSIGKVFMQQGGMVHMIGEPDMFLRQVDTSGHFLVTFFWLAIPLLIIIFLASLYFANRSIKPVEDAFIKQKEFVADASHELKTPLATISANADVLLQGANKTSKKWADHIKVETGRMASLIDSMLYLAKIDYESKPNFENINLGDLLNEVLLPLEAIIHEKKVNLQVATISDVIVQGNKAELHRLLVILIDNAIKYTNGEIKISIGKMNLHTQIIVQNSGEPIPKEKLDKLFDRFYRIDESHEYTGSFGLGLSIAKAIVDKHDGEIKCESNGYVKFIVTL